MLIVILITIGLITLMTILTYLLEQQVHRRQNRYWTIGAHGAEALSVLISMILLRQIFITLNSGSIISWTYATVQLTILLFSLNTMRNLAVEIINLLMPLFRPSGWATARSTCQFFWPWPLSWLVQSSILLITIKNYTLLNGSISCSKYYIVALGGALFGQFIRSNWAIHSSSF